MNESLSEEQKEVENKNVLNIVPIPINKEAYEALEGWFSECKEKGVRGFVGLSICSDGTVFRSFMYGSGTNVYQLVGALELVKSEIISGSGYTIIKNTP